MFNAAVEAGEMVVIGNGLLVIGPILIGVGLSIWGFTDGNRSVALWFGVAGVMVLVLGFALQAQYEINKRKSPVTSDNALGNDRAYADISFAAVLLNSPKPGFVTAWVRFKNSGKTPAYNFRGWLLFHQRSTEDLPFHMTREFENSVVLGIGQESNLYGTLPISPAELAAIQNGSRSLFVWGQANYDDANKSPHHHAFKAQMSGPTETIVVDGERASGWGMKMIPNGEDAN